MRMFSVRAGGLVLSLGMAAACGAWLAAESPAQSPPLALLGARLLTQTDQGEIVGTIVVRDGKITAIGPEVEIPKDARQIDCAGFVITPGLIDARSSLWLSPEFTRDNAKDGSLDILDAVNPYSEDWREVVRNGITTVYVQPTSSANLGGFGAVLKVAPAAQTKDLVIRSDAALQASLGVGNAGNSLLRWQQVDALKNFLAAVKKYQDDKPAKKDPLKERHVALVKREMPLRLEAHYDDDLRNGLKLADEFKHKLILEGVSKPTATAAEIKSRRIPVVLGPILDLEPLSGMARQRAADWPNNFLAEDARFAVGTYSNQPRASQWLRLHAAALASKGIRSERILRALTADAADLLGVGDQLGRLAVGHRATFAVFTGNPLDASAAARWVLVDGNVVHENAKAKARSQPLAAVPAASEGLVSAAVALASSDESTDPVTPELRPADLFDPKNKLLRDHKAEGFRSAVLLPPPANVVAGELMACDLGGKHPITTKSLGFQFVLTGAARNRERYPFSLVGQREVIDAALAGEAPPSSLFLPRFLADQLATERQATVRRLLSQREVAYFQADAPAEIDTALEIIEKHRLKAVLVRPSRITPFLSEIKRLDVAILVPPVTNEDYARVQEELVLASQAGIPLLFGDASPTRLRATAAALVAAGADAEQVLAGLSTGGSKLLGLSPTSKELLSWSGSPLDLRSQPSWLPAAAAAESISAQTHAEHR